MNLPFSFPPDYLDQMAALLGPEFPAFNACIHSPTPASGLRINSLKDARQSVLSAFGINPQSQAIPWCPSGYRIHEDQASGKHPYHAAGLYYLQEPSAMAAAEILDPQPGENILDLAAAPGGKATHLAALMQGQGMLVANEIHPQRVWELTENLERWGCRNAVITQESPARLADQLGAFFDRVLLDAPCSGEGMFRKSAAARRDWSLNSIKSCAARQTSILNEACRLVRAGGVLVYSTCTFNPEENEEVIACFLEHHPEFKMDDVSRLPGASPGRPEWLEAGQTPESSSPAPDRQDLRQAVRFWPHRPGLESPSPEEQFPLPACEGHFIARMRNIEETSSALHPAGKGKAVRQLHGKNQGTPISQNDKRDGLKVFYNFSDETLLAEEINPIRLAIVGAYLYYETGNLPDLAGLSIIRPGWWLGTIKSRRFEPSHALALGLNKQDVKQTVEFKVDAPELRAYLHGETIASPGEDGWILVCIDGFPLGWARRSAGILKNHYPRGLRGVY